jgi:thiol-disulfide isomerase/thioredoxin
MKKIIITWLSLCIAAFAYQAGDTLSKEIQNQTKITKEKIYIIDFFASWCNSCKKEIPHLSKLNNTIDKSKIELIGIDVDEDINAGHKFQAMLKANGDLNFKVIDDPNGKIVKEFSPIGMPAIYIVKNNKVVDYIFGARDNIDQLILKTIKELK